MKQVVCAVFDRAAQLFGRPFFVAHRAQAQRSFSDEVNRSDSDFGKHPGDFDLYCLATYEDGSGDFFECRELIVRGKDVVGVRDE